MALISKIYSAVPGPAPSSISRKEKQRRAHWMRMNPTPPEKILWDALKNRKLAGLDFRRQTLLRGWIVDFYCPQYRLIVEMDGKCHGHRKKQDAERDRILNENGFNVLRVPAKLVFRKLNSVLGRIRGRISTPEQLPKSVNDEDGGCV